MLPQRTIVKPPTIASKTDLDDHDAVAAPLTRSKARESLKPLDVGKGRTTLMPPPRTVNMPRSTKEPHQIRQASQPTSGSLSRMSSSAKALDQDGSETSAKPRATPKVMEMPAITQDSKHRWSRSQQIGEAPLSNVSKLPSLAPPLRQSSLKVSKPAFSAMQQHYSPKKKLSPLAPNEPSTAAKASDSDYIESANLQVELSQLHMMHRSAASVQCQWEQSAKNICQSRFNELCVRHIELKEIAHQQRTLLNQLALVEWCQGVPSAHIAEKVQQVSRNIADIRSLLEPEGKYSRVLGIFQSWFARARQVESSRDAHNDSFKGEDLVFIEGIGDGWKAEAMVLERELTYFLRELKAFGEIRAVSSLGRILSLHRTLVSNLLEELDVIQWIENETMLREGMLVEQTISKLSSNVSKKI